MIIQRFLWCSDELSVGNEAVALVVFPRNGLYFAVSVGV